MRFIAIDDAVRNARATAARFPFVLLAALAAAVTAQVAVDADDDALFRLLFTAALGLPLLFALAVTGERRAWSRTVRVGVALASIGLLIGLHIAANGWSDPLGSSAGNLSSLSSMRLRRKSFSTESVQ